MENIKNNLLYVLCFSWNLTLICMDTTDTIYANKNKNVSKILLVSRESLDKDYYTLKNLEQSLLADSDDFVHVIHETDPAEIKKQNKCIQKVDQYIHYLHIKKTIVTTVQIAAKILQSLED